MDVSRVVLCANGRDTLHASECESEHTEHNGPLAAHSADQHIRLALDIQNNFIRPIAVRRTEMIMI